MKLAYTAYDGAGKAVDGTLECSDVLSAAELLRQKGLYVASVSEVNRGQKQSRSGWKMHWRAKDRVKTLALFARQLSVLISSGTQLVEALIALERQTPGGLWQNTLHGLRSKVEQGASLSEAMEAHQHYFDPIYRALVGAGESTGKLVEMLDQLATLKQRELRVRNALVGALTYPALLASLSGAMCCVVLAFVVPKFAVLFDTLDVPLPFTTQTLVNFSEFFRDYWWVWLLVLGVSIAGGVKFMRTPSGKRFRDTALLRIPYLRDVVKSLVTARTVRLLGVLLSGHVPILAALRLVRSAAGNVHYEELLSEAEANVEKGEPMGLAFSRADLISPTVQEAIRSGERSGHVEHLLLHVADFLDDDNQTVIRSLTSIIEPLILVVMGIVVAFVAVSMFLPLFDLTAMTQGGGV
jgi:type IV pilus assembly protein PilC